MTSPEGPRSHEGEPNPELPSLEESQHRLARAKAEMMRPGLSGWIGPLQKRREAEYESAKAENFAVMARDLKEGLHEFVTENEVSRHSDEAWNYTIEQVIENKKKIDELSINEEYAGKKAGLFIAIVRDTNPKVRFALGFFAGVGGVATVWANAAIMSRLGRNHVASHAVRIGMSDTEVSDQLKEHFEGHEENKTINSSRRESMIQLTHEAMDVRVEEERGRIAAEVGPIAVASVAGLAVNAVGSGSQHIF